MAFSYDKFLRPISSGDKNVFIYNDSGILLYTINPQTIVNTFASNNLVKISLKSQRVISLDFLNAALAKIALQLLQKHIDQLKANNPILGVEGPTGFQGYTGPQGPLGPEGGTGPATRNDQFTNVTYSIITHSSGKYPLVQVLDNSGNMNIPYNVRHISTHSFMVEFSQAESGTIITGGAFGPQGATSYGDTGPQGHTGPQGVQGGFGSPAMKTDLNDGLSGPTNSITVTHNLGSYPLVQALFTDGADYFSIQQSSYSITYNDLDTYTITFDTDYEGFVLSGGGLSGPQGEFGFQGDTGPQGNTGPQGQTGFQGDTGPQGNTGFQGDTGPQGPRGFAGVTGLQGPGAPGALNTRIESYANGATNSLLIEHRLGSYPLVQAIDNNGRIINPSSYSIVHITPDRYRITFNDNYRGQVITGGGITGPQGPAVDNDNPLFFLPGFTAMSFDSVNTSGTISIWGDIIPATDYTERGYSLGSPTNRWENIYVKDANVSANSIFIGDIRLSMATNSITGQASLVINDVVNNNSIELAPNTSNTFLIGSATMAMEGNFVPVTSSTYDLGTNNNYWNHLYTKDVVLLDNGKIFFEVGQSLHLSDGVIYINDVPFTNGGVGQTIYSTTGVTALSFTTSTNLSWANIVPYQNNLDLGRTASRWSTLYVNDIFANGDIYLPEGSSLYIGGLKFSTRLTGTSNDLLTVQDAGYYLELTTQKYLSFERGSSVIVSNGLEEFYVDDEYYEDNSAAVMFCIVNSYDIQTGILGLVVERTIGLGRTASNWTINISGRQGVTSIGGGTGLQGPTGPQGPLPFQQGEPFNWNSLILYNPNDVVFYSDLLYILSDYENYVQSPTPDAGLGWRPFYLNQLPGTQGPTGPQGVDGVQGPQGLPGLDGGNSTLNFTFSDVNSFNVTHNSGLFPLVQIVDNLGNSFIPDSIIHTTTASFDVIFATTSSGVILVGGAAGPQGSMGELGPQGEQGPQGDMGPMGDAGFQGFTGPQGRTGPQGFQGFEGPQGNVGPIGPTGSAPILYLLEAYANVTYTLPGGFTDDTCRYSIVNNTVNVPSGWFNTSTYRFTPQKAGYWEITASYDVYRNSEASLAIRKNGGVVAAAGSFNAVAQTVTKIVYLNGSTDYVDAMNTGGAALSRGQYDSRSWFQARWIGE